jgi:hypothetical protein
MRKTGRHRIVAVFRRIPEETFEKMRTGLIWAPVESIL